MKNIAIDIHSHINHGARFDSKPVDYGKIYCAEKEFLLEEYKRTNILCGGFSTFDSVLSNRNVYAENEYMSNLAQIEKNVFFWAVLSPLDKNSYSQVEKLLKNPKCLGIKIHSVYHQYDILRYGGEIFDFANQMKAWVLMHNDKILSMPNFANENPRMKLIIAHLGSSEHIEAIKTARYGNIYTDTSGIASSNNNIIEYAVKEVGAEKIFFGTDTYSCGFQKGRIEYADIKDIDKEKILYTNAKQSFINFSDIGGNLCR